MLKIVTLHYLTQLKVSPQTEPLSSSPTKRQKVCSQSEQDREPIQWKIKYLPLYNPRIYGVRSNLSPARFIYIYIEH